MTGASLPADACQGRCVSVGNRTGHLVDIIEQDYRADSRATEDKNTKIPRGSSSSRAKAKILSKEKGSRLARAAVIIGMFMFSVVSVCC